jgi:hypothetical protein
MREPRYRSSGVYQEPLWGKDVSQKNQVIWCWIEGNCVQIMPALGSQIGTGRHTLGYFISPAAVIPTLRGTKWGVWRCCRHWFPSSKQILELKSIYILATLIRDSVNSARFTTYSSQYIRARRMGHSSRVVNRLSMQVRSNISWESVNKQSLKEKYQLLVLREQHEHLIHQLWGMLVREKKEAL